MPNTMALFSSCLLLLSLLKFSSCLLLNPGDSNGGHVSSAAIQQQFDLKFTVLEQRMQLKEIAQNQTIARLQQRVADLERREMPNATPQDTKYMEIIAELNKTITKQQNVISRLEQQQQGKIYSMIALTIFVSYVHHVAFLLWLFVSGEAISFDILLHTTPGIQGSFCHSNWHSVRNRCVIHILSHFCVSKSLYRIVKSQKDVYLVITIFRKPVCNSFQCLFHQVWS